MTAIRGCPDYYYGLTNDSVSEGRLIEVEWEAAPAQTYPIAIRVDRPADVGADRLVNALAAARIHGTPALVADFGTATTIDCVAAERRGLGQPVARFR